MKNRSKELLAFMTFASQCTMVRFQCAECNTITATELNPGTSSPMELSKMIAEAAIVAMDNDGWRYAQGIGNVCRQCVQKSPKVAARVAENDMGGS